MTPSVTSVTPTSGELLVKLRLFVNSDGLSMMSPPPVLWKLSLHGVAVSHQFYQLGMFC